MALGERKHADRIAYGMPDVLGRDRASYAGRHTVVVGAGYSAANVLLDLAELAHHESGTAITWVVRGTSLVRVYGGGLADELPARGALGWRLKELVDRRAIDLVLGFAATAVKPSTAGSSLREKPPRGLSGSARPTGSWWPRSNGPI